jgi:hypothetical protein
MDDRIAFARLVDAVRPWLGHLVIVGGWAHQLHRRHPAASIPPYEPLRTRDADLAFSTKAPLVGDIRAALEAADFDEDFSGDHTPPVSQYRLGEEDQGFYVEFLAPLTGDGVRRNGDADATLAKAGITAQKLRHVELLLLHPWTIRLSKAVDVPIAEPADVMVANPVTFIAQKMLIQKHRKPDKRPQDALYIHDTLELFGHDLEALRTEWLDGVRPAIAPKTVRDLERLRLQQFGAVTDVIRAAARIPQGRSLAPERMQAACAYGLGEVFGDG